MLFSRIGMMNYGSISPPSPGYYECIHKGYRDNGMDTHYLEKALADSCGGQDADIFEDFKETDELSEEDGWNFWGTM